MNKKSLGAIVVNLLAVTIPTAALAARYGLDTKVNIQDASEGLSQVFVMGAAIVSGFVMAVMGSRLLSADENPLQKLVSMIMADFGKTRKAKS